MARQDTFGTMRLPAGARGVVSAPATTPRAVPRRSDVLTTLWGTNEYGATEDPTVGSGGRHACGTLRARSRHAWWHGRGTVDCVAWWPPYVNRHELKRAVDRGKVVQCIQPCGGKVHARQRIPDAHQSLERRNRAAVRKAVSATCLAACACRLSLHLDLEATRPSNADRDHDSRR
jgi:hypothetical protein